MSLALMQATGNRKAGRRPPWSGPSARTKEKTRSLTRPTSREPSREAVQQRLKPLQGRFELLLPGKASAAVGPDQLQAGKRPRRCTVEPDRGAEIVIVALERHIDEADLVAGQDVVAHLAGGVAPAVCGAVADVVDDGGGIPAVQAEDHDFRMTVVDEEADREGVGRPVIVGHDPDDMASMLADVANDGLVGLATRLRPFKGVGHRRVSMQQANVRWASEGRA